MPRPRNTLVLRYPDGTERVPRAKEVVRDIPTGTVYCQQAGGGGGYGDPYERPADLVAEDVRNELISPARAAADYGVVVDPASFAVDEAATEKLRNARR